MKKLLHIFLLLCISQSLLAQNAKGIVYLDDGSKLTGLVKITKSNKVKFRKNSDSKKHTFSKHSIDKVIFLKAGGATSEYIFRETIPSVPASIQAMKLITKGKINLYKTVTQGSYYFPSGMPGQSFAMGHSFTISNYFVGKEGSKSVERLTSQGALFDKNFKKAATEYFKDCPELVKLIENKTFRKNDIEEIVRYYNEKC